MAFTDKEPKPRQKSLSKNLRDIWEHTLNSRNYGACTTREGPPQP